MMKSNFVTKMSFQKQNQIQTLDHFKTQGNKKRYMTQEFILVRLNHRDYIQFLVNYQILLTSQSYKYLSLSLLALTTQALHQA